MIVYSELFQYMLLLRGATRLFQSLSALPKFQYMLLLRGATAEALRIAQAMYSFNTCSSCEEQRDGAGFCKYLHVVSIHAPLARSNDSRAPAHRIDLCFNTCSSCEEQLQSACGSPEAYQFQYMLLLRGATRGNNHLPKMLKVSIHAPLARSNTETDADFFFVAVSIHAPLARSNSPCAPQSLLH